MKKIAKMMALTLGACMSLTAFSGCNFLENALTKPLDGEEAEKAYAEYVEAMEYAKSYNGPFTIDVKTDYSSGGEQYEKIRIGVDPSTEKVYMKGKSGEGKTKGKLYKVDDTYYMHSQYDDDTSEFTYATAERVDTLRFAYQNYFENWEGSTWAGIIEGNAIFASLFEEAKLEIMSKADNSESIYYGVTHVDGKIETSVGKLGNAYIVKSEQYVNLQKGEESLVLNYITQFKVKGGKIVGIKVDNSYERTEIWNGEIETYAYSYTQDIKISYKFNELEYRLMNIPVEKDGEKRNFFNPKDIIDFLGDDLLDEDVWFYGEKDLYVNGSFCKQEILSGRTIEGTVLFEGLNWDEGLDYTYYVDEACTEPLATLQQFNVCDAIYIVATPKEGYALINENFQFTMDDIATKDRRLLDLIFRNAFMSNGATWESIYTYDVVDLNRTSEYEMWGLTDVLSDFEGTEVYVDGVLYEGDTLAVESGRTYNVVYKQIFTQEMVDVFFEEEEINIIMYFTGNIL